jgi:hypothetical protein
VLLAGCAGRDAGDWADVREVTPSILAAQGATDAALAADRRGRVALTWVTRDSLGQDLWLALSADSGVTFASPIRVNPARGSVSSSSEGRPVAAYGAEGELLVAWSERRGDSLGSTDLIVRASGDGGRTFGPSVVVNDDFAAGRPGAHGSPALVALPGDGWFAVWTDPREHVAAGDSAGVASLFHATSSDGGQSWSDNRPLTMWACPGCRVTALTDSTGMVAVAYRAAFGDMRDPALAVSWDRGASFALDTLLSADGWELPRSPAEGPTLTMDHAGGGHYAWFTGAPGNGAWIAPWRAEGGIVGLRRALSDSVVSARHPTIARLGAATLVAVETPSRTDPSHGVIAVRALDADGALTPWQFLGADAAHAWLAPVGERSALVCWTERGAEGDRVRVARLTRR